MTATVRAYKGLLTKRNQSALDWLQESYNRLNSLSEAEATERNYEGNLRLALSTCEEYINVLESSLAKLAKAYDEIGDHSEEEDKQFDKYMETSQETIMRLQRHKPELQGFLHSHSQSTQQGTVHQETLADGGMTPLAISKLPQIPIPTFAGKRWEWDNFWTLFQANVHEQNLTDLQKFNYLLSALRGEARQSVSRFHITAANYEKAVEHLRKRYGGKDGIVMELNKALTVCTANGPSTSEQRRLFDRLSSLASQLREHGENLNNQLTIHTFVNKFHARFQRSAMERRIKEDNRLEWNLEQWLNTIDQSIAQEELLEEMLPRNTEQGRQLSNKERWRSPNCEYCQQKGHRWNTCTKIPNPSARRAFLVDTNRCLNCGSTTHRASTCPGGSCRKCAGRHHTAICQRDTMGTQGRESRTREGVSNTNKQGEKTEPPRISSPAKGWKEKPPQRKSAHQHAVISEISQREDSSEKDTVVLSLNENSQVNHHKVILLAGLVNVLNSEGVAQKVTVLLDTGSELSFIEERLAESLGLPVVEKSSLLICTFGSSKPIQKDCDITTLKLEDIEGVQHEVRLHKNNFITGTMEQAELDQSDLDFIDKQGIFLSLPRDQRVIQPQILLGCDYLWNFMIPGGHRVLPSGLLLIPTKLGYLISGRQTISTTEPSTVWSILGESSEKEMWDRYWCLESLGTHEYTGTQRTEQQLVNDRVIEEFKNTIQHREDGYYVRLPWKDEHPILPDNKLIALKRLEKIIDMYANDHDTLEQYDKIFREQKEKGIIEEVSKEDTSSNVVHYLPHQAVITPMKDTTKMRIVFDASAHYKNSPSLNDVLHQGPLMLPDMTGMLLRFRMHKIAVIADVEKAFLQVRLQEVDRDATRCLWVRDINRPVTPDNILTYRFTRVTFGLNTSPFLLAATIAFHLDNLEESNEMAHEIRRNLYVDNLIYGAATTEDAVAKYQQSKRIFEGLKMNLREFMSNDGTFNSHLSEKDRSANFRPKVLGIPWNTITDKIILKSTMLPLKEITKRTISQQVASVFDPLGMLAPLLLPAKVFLQSLWKEEFSWDEQLPPKLQEQWRILSGQISTFYKELDRLLLSKESTYKLFAFSDASQFAIATCI